MRRWWKLRGTETWEHVKPWWLPRPVTDDDKPYMVTIPDSIVIKRQRMWRRVRGNLDPRPPLGKGW